MSDTVDKRVRVTDRGQVTIPKEIRDAAGIAAPGDVIVKRRDSGTVVIEPIPTVEDLRGSLRDDGDLDDTDAEAADAEDADTEDADAVLAESRRVDAEAVERLVGESE